MCLAATLSIVEAFDDVAAIDCVTIKDVTAIDDKPQSVCSIPAISMTVDWVPKSTQKPFGAVIVTLPNPLPCPRSSSAYLIS